MWLLNYALRIVRKENNLRISRTDISSNKRIIENLKFRGKVDLGKINGEDFSKENEDQFTGPPIHHLVLWSIFEYEGGIFRNW